MFGFQRNPDVAGNGRSGGQEHIRLIAIDYHTATGTAGAEYKGDQRSKMARQPESGMDSGGLMETQEQGDLEVEQEGQIKARGTDESNVDSEDTKYREEILNTTLSGTEKIRMKYKSPKEVWVT